MSFLFLPPIILTVFSMPDVDTHPAQIEVDPRASCTETLKGPEGSFKIVEGNNTRGAREITICFKHGAESQIDIEKIGPLHSDDRVNLVVNSGGGNVLDFLPIAEKIIAAELHLYIDDYCLSSCANYFAGIADSIYLQDGSVLGWHGGIEGAALGSDTKELYDSVVSREKALFSKRVLSRKLIYDSGKIVGCSWVRSYGRFLSKDDFSLYWAPNANVLTEVYGLNIIDTAAASSETKNEIVLIDQRNRDVLFKPKPEGCRV